MCCRSANLNLEKQWGQKCVQNTELSKINNPPLQKTNKLVLQPFNSKIFKSLYFVSIIYYFSLQGFFFVFFGNHSLDFLNSAGLYLDLIFYKVRKKMHWATFKIHFCCISFSIFALLYSLLHSLNYDDDRKTLNTSSRVLIKSPRSDACGKTWPIFCFENSFLSFHHLT